MIMTIRYTHTKAVYVFIKFRGVKSALIQKVISSVEETYLANIHNRNSKVITVMIFHILIHLKYKYGHLMLHELLDR